MSDTNLNSDKVQVDGSQTPIKIKEEHLEELLRIQSFVDSLSKYRQEMGRLLQLQGNMLDEANKVEIELADARRSLTDKYDLQGTGSGQWALDFERKEFVKTAPGTPVIP